MNMMFTNHFHKHSLAHTGTQTLAHHIRNDSVRRGAQTMRTRARRPKRVVQVRVRQLRAQPPRLGTERRVSERRTKLRRRRRYRDGTTPHRIDDGDDCMHGTTSTKRHRVSHARSVVGFGRGLRNGFARNRRAVVVSHRTDGRTRFLTSAHT